MNPDAVGILNLVYSVDTNHECVRNKKCLCTHYSLLMCVCVKFKG